MRQMFERVYISIYLVIIYKIVIFNKFIEQNQFLVIIAKDKYLRYTRYLIIELNI